MSGLKNSHFLIFSFFLVTALVADAEYQQVVSIELRAIRLASDFGTLELSNPGPFVRAALQSGLLSIHACSAYKKCRAVENAFDAGSWRLQSPQQIPAGLELRILGVSCGFHHLDSLAVGIPEYFNDGYRIDLFLSLPIDLQIERIVYIGKKSEKVVEGSIVIDNNKIRQALSRTELFSSEQKAKISEISNRTFSSMDEIYDILKLDIFYDLDQIDFLNEYKIVGEKPVYFIDNSQLTPSISLIGQMNKISLFIKPSTFFIQAMISNFIERVPGQITIDCEVHFSVLGRRQATKLSIDPYLFYPKRQASDKSLGFFRFLKQ